MTIKNLRELLTYDPVSGEFFWKVPRSNRPKGSRAGTTLKIRKPSGIKPYRSIRVNRKHYFEHRLAWEFENGQIPPGMQIDHINGVTDDNRIANLRLATQSQNNHNRPSRSKSGHRGVYKHSQSKGWIAELVIGGKNVLKSYYPTYEEAVNSRLSAEIKYGVAKYMRQI